MSALMDAIGAIAPTGNDPSDYTSMPDAIGRRLENDPGNLIATGLKHADDPNTPLDFSTRMAVAEPLLRAKHFGYGGGLNGQVNMPQPQQNDGVQKIMAGAKLAEMLA